MDLGLSGKIAMVTGGSNGLGKHITCALAKEGCHVSICARGKQRLDSTEAELKTLGVKVLTSVADVTVETDAEDFYNRTVSKLGVPDILVNNVGGRRGSTQIEETTMETFMDGLNVNLISAVRLINLVLPDMRKNRWGRIINIASVYGREYGGSSDYMTGKAGLIAFSKHIALQLVSENVLVNCIAPGSIDFSGSVWERFQENNTADVVNDFISRNLPAGRFGWPEPIGDTVAFLASDRADLISGACVNVDGGQSRSLF
jgi:3-oxoacyl-[acyl-carrier protein] reductase